MYSTEYTGTNNTLKPYIRNV